ncbi:MAG: hypothetical protein ACFFD4_28695 [Candidatus Odinarchaeota archaeon]
MHEEIHFQTQLATGITTRAETIEKYEKNMRSKRRMILLGNLAICYAFGIITILPVIGILFLLSVEMTVASFDAIIFAGSLILTIYNLYIFFILFMAGLMNYITLMRGDCFDLLRPIPLSSRDLTWLSIFVFIRMNIIQLTFILFALPVAVLVLTLSPLVFTILLLNNLVNLAFIVPTLVVISWILAQKVFNTSEKSSLGPIITVLTMVIYAFTVIPVFFLMSSLGQVIEVLFTFSLTSGNISSELNHILSMIPFPFSSNYFTSLVLLLPSEAVPASMVFSSFAGVLTFLGLVAVIFWKGNSLIRNLAFEPVVVKKKKLTDENKIIQVKTSIPVITFTKKSLKMVFRDYGALTLFVLGALFPTIILMMATAMPERYIERGGLTGFTVTMTVFTLGAFIFLFYNSLKLSERNLGGTLSTLPFKERDLFRSKQIIIVIASEIPIIITFLLLQGLLSLQLFQSLLKIIFLDMIVVTEFLLLFVLLFGKINNRYSFTVENIENEILKLVVIFGLIYGSIFGFLLITDAVASILHREIGVVIILGTLLILTLELITRRMFPQESPV